MHTVLIIGISAFAGAHVALNFLQHGWSVNGTTRSSSNHDAIRSIREFQPYLEKIKLFAIGDVAESTADTYAEAIKDVEAVVQIATPVGFEGHDFHNLFRKPAVQATISMLEAAEKQPSVKSVVVTGSITEVFDPTKPWAEQSGKLYDESDWNPYSVEELTDMGNKRLEGNGAFRSGFLFYAGAKKFAEQTALEYKEQHRSKFSLAFILPSFMAGPSIEPNPKLSNTNVSNIVQYGVLKNDKVIASFIIGNVPLYIDVRDAAEAHYQAVVRNANGRFIVSVREHFNYQKLVDSVHKIFPEETKDRVELGTPGDWPEDDAPPCINNEKGIRELNVHFRPFEETVRDTYKRYFELEAQSTCGSS